MDNNILIAIVSVLLFVVGGLVLNFEAKRQERKDAAAAKPSEGAAVIEAPRFEEAA